MEFERRLDMFQTLIIGKENMILQLLLIYVNKKKHYSCPLEILTQIDRINLEKIVCSFGVNKYLLGKRCNICMRALCTFGSVNDVE